MRTLELFQFAVDRLFSMSDASDLDSCADLINCTSLDELINRILSSNIRREFKEEIIRQLINNLEQQVSTESSVDQLHLLREYITDNTNQTEPLPFDITGDFIDFKQELEVVIRTITSDNPTNTLSVSQSVIDNTIVISNTEISDVT